MHTSGRSGVILMGDIKRIMYTPSSYKLGASNIQHILIKLDHICTGILADDKTEVVSWWA